MKKAFALAIAAVFATGAMAQQPVQQQENKEQKPAMQRPMRPMHRDTGAVHLDRQHPIGDSASIHRRGDRLRGPQGPDSRMHRHGGPHAQRRHQEPQKPAELQYNADGIETTLAKAFPGAKNVKKTARWTEVYDGKKKLIGYGVYSKPASDSIRGYAGETPVLITLNAKKIITGVYALPNVETPRFQQRVVEAGFFNNWNGLSIKQAKKKTVDTVSGATFTSRAVAQSVQAALEKL